MMFPVFSSMLGAVGRKRLSVCEMHRADVVELPRLDNAPTWSRYTTGHEPIEFTGIALAHAVIMADFLDRPSPLMPGLGFLLESERFVDWSQPTLLLQDGALDRLSDFVRNSLVGRIGQGLTILFAQSRGYVFKTHLSAHLAGLGKVVRNDAGKLLPIADFVCETSASDLAIFESKAAGRSGPNDITKTKSLLKRALLTQVRPWLQLGRVPGVTKGFVVCSYLRETSRGLSSTLVFVDPEIENNGQQGESPPTAAIRRWNYSAWFRAMGLEGPAARLLHQFRRPEFHHFDLAKIGGVQIALPAACAQWSRPERHDSVLAAGISLEALKAVEAALQDDEGPLLRLRSVPTEDRQEREAAYSLFADGTFLGRYPEGALTGEQAEVFI